MPRRIALFGGTFDPPHLGHLAAASEVRHAAAYDELLLVVSHQPWQKGSGREVTPSAVRLEMTIAAVGVRDGLAVSDVEIRRGGPTYTIDTVEQLTAADPGVDVGLVLGEDAAARLGTWHRAEELARMVEVVVVPRPGARSSRPGGAPPVPPRLPPAPWRARAIDVPALDISSTMIRERCRDGRPIDFLVPDPVVSIIRERGLYGVAR